MNGEDHGLETFIREYGNKLISYLVGRGAPPDMAQEAANDAYLILHRLHDQGRAPASPAAYMRTTALRLVNKAYKKHYGGELPDSEHLESIVDPVAPEVEQMMLRENIRRLVQQLPPRQRQVITYRYLFDYNVTETAGQLEISLKAVKDNTVAALRNLRRLANENPIWEEETR